MRKTLLTLLLTGALALGAGKAKAQEAKVDSTKSKQEQYYFESGRTWDIRSKDQNYFFGAGVQNQNTSVGFYLYLPLDGKSSYLSDANWYDTTAGKTISLEGDLRTVDVIKFGVESEVGNKYGKIGPGMFFVIYGSETTRRDTKEVQTRGSGGMGFSLNGEVNLTPYVALTGKLQASLWRLESTALGLRIPVWDKK